MKTSTYIAEGPGNGLGQPTIIIDMAPDSLEDEEVAASINRVIDLSLENGISIDVIVITHTEDETCITTAYGTRDIAS